MALLGYAGGGELGNFGHVGVDQATFGPAVFLWFVAIGGLTVAMAGGVARTPKVATPREVPVEDVEVEEFEPEPEPEFEPAFESEPDVESDLEPAFDAEEDEPLDPIPPKPTFGRESASSSNQNVHFDDDLPDPEDLEYIDDDDATPGPTGDQRRPADD
jgi:hypothetical protein